jgi:hypothetical protein
MSNYVYISKCEELTEIPKILNSNSDIDSIICRLPQELKNKIYREYFEPEYYFEIYNRIIVECVFDSYTGMENIRRLLPSILVKPITITYISLKSEAFDDCYKKHKLLNKKLFKHKKMGISFATSIILYIYH